MWWSFVRLIRLIDPEFPEAPPVAPFSLGEEERARARAWLGQALGAACGRRVALHMGSGPGQPFRRWPVERFVEFAERLRAEVPGLGIVLTGTAPEKPVVDAFLSRYGSVAADATGLGSLERTAALLSACDLLISNDTGIMHLGAAMGTPTVGIFGSDTPKRYAPVGPRAAAVAASGVSCSPCSDIYRLRVPATCANPDHIRCLREVTVERVLEAATRVVAGGWLGRVTQPETAAQP